MTDLSPVIWWVRRDLRLTDNPALTAACESGRPVIPVFVLDEVFESYGAAPKWRLGLGLDRFAETLREAGSRLILRRGPALDTLRAVIAETGATAVHWGRLVDPDARARDTRVKAGLKRDGVAADSHPGHLLFEPWSVATGSGGPYKVYTPFWRAVKDREVAEPARARSPLPAPETWPESCALDDWALGRAMDRGAEVVGRWVTVGEEAARGRLGAFMAHKVEDYAEARDLPGIAGTSKLSENLAHGEIGIATCWHAGMRAREQGKAGAETFLRELVWRDFAYHLAYHTPRLTSANWREEWDGFPWNEDAGRADVVAWQRGRTGIEFVDAAMREIYVTGHMHNRARMIVASYLTKHLLSHWKIGQRWFEEHLIDWDPASNAMGWQWSAGSGPDATPYFRVFNPVTQLDRFDRDRAYVGRWIAEGRGRPTAEALSWFEAVPRHWGLSPDDPYPEPVVGPKEGRARALAAYEARDF